MTTKRIVRRAIAQNDLETAVAYYQAEAGDQTALRFVDAFEVAVQHIARRPAAGSPRYAHELDMSGLRMWPLRHYPYLVFYVDRGDHIDVLRIVHNGRDLFAALRDGAD